MKRIPNAGKLTLNRESLKSLSAPELGQAQGGGSYGYNCVAVGAGRPIGSNISTADQYAMPGYNFNFAFNVGWG